MKHSVLRSLAALAAASALLPAGFAIGALAEGCNTKALGLPSPEGGTDYNEIPDVVTAETIIPPTATVLTCDSLQLRSEAVFGAWTLQGPGSLAPQPGEQLSESPTVTYTGPNTLPATPTAVVSEVAGTSHGSATLTLATAVVGTAAVVPVDGNTFVGALVPLEHPFVASGNQVYAAMPGPLVANDSGSDVNDEMIVYASSNGGTSFTQASTYYTGDLFCGAIAVDPGDANVVYMTYASGHGESTTNTGSTIRLAVSTDGAKTFPVEYVIADTGPGNASWTGCPDVASPSPDNVIVTNVFYPNDLFWVATFASNNRGANIGMVGSEDQFDGGEGYVAPSDTNMGTQSANPINGNAEYSPRIFADGKGDACIAYVDPNTTAVLVQCSSNNGATWNSPRAVSMLSGSNTLANGAISPGGNIAIAIETGHTTTGGTAFNETIVVFSKDGGNTFGDASAYPMPSFASLSQAEEVQIRWESDSILWLSQTVSMSNGPGLLVDKTCDFGQSWSGAVNAGAYAAAGLATTTAGMVAGAFVPGDDPGGPLLVLVPLAP